MTASERHVLIIDDEANMRHMLQVMLDKEGYIVRTAADGMEGLSILEKEPFDFVLCDLRMPKMDGMTFLNSHALVHANRLP